MRRNIFICLLLAGITLAVYWPVGGYDYVRYDDPLFFVENPAVQTGLNWHSFVWAMSSVVAANWHPATSFSFVLTHQFFGTNAHAEHLVNVAFHIANALLLFLVLQRMVNTLPANSPSPLQKGGEGRGEEVHLFSDQIPSPQPSPRLGGAREPEAVTRPAEDATWRCALVAGVFALHPLRVESVAWIAERKDVLCGFFLMLTLWAWTRYAQRKEKGGRKSDLRPPASVFYWLALLFFALGLMSKAMVVTLPFLLLLLDVWPLKRVTSDNWQVTEWKKLVLEKIPFFALSAVFCVITFWVQKNSAAVVSLDMVGFSDRIGHTFVSYLQYLIKFFWPTNLAIIYPYSVNEWPAREIWLTAMLLVAVTALCICLFPRKPYVAIGWFWYLGTAVPIIGLVQIGETAMADRYTYIPLIGPVIALVWLVSEKWKHETFQRSILGVSACALLASLAILTNRQVHYWKNTVSLFEHAVEVTGNSYSAHNGLAIGLEQEGRVREAMVHYRIAMSLNPRETQNCKNMAQLLMQQEKWNEAAQLEFAVLEIEPNGLPAHLNLAFILQHLGRNSEAMLQLETALEINPDSPESLNNLAWMLATSEDQKIRDGTRAVQLAERACSLTGYKTTAYIGTLAAAYAEAGRFDDAIATAEKACELAEKSGEQRLLQKNRELLELYRAHKSYHEAPEKVIPVAP